MTNQDDLSGAAPVAPPADADPLFASGVTLGSWRIVKLLGEGGMGRVYLAEHTSIGRRVALKVLKRALACCPALVERFFAEAHAVNRIRHPGIVEVTDCFVDGDGTPCLVMELLEGRTLAHEIAATPLDAARVAAIGADVALALEAAHNAGVIHRDMKPDNLFLVEQDGVTSVKVLDFGVAKLMDPMPQSTVHTVAGSIMGTPDYMAPEQLSGKPVDGRADIYALGASLYHACTGRLPFPATNFGDLVVMHLTTPPPPPSNFANVPSALEQVLLAMLEKDPARRPQTMGDVALLLRSTQEIGGALAALERADLAVGPWPGSTAAFVAAPLELRETIVAIPAPPPAPIWAWAAVAALLCIAASGGAWAVVHDEPRLVAIAGSYRPLAVTVAPPATEQRDATAHVDGSAPVDNALVDSVLVDNVLVDSAAVSRKRVDNARARKGAPLAPETGTLTSTVRPPRSPVLVKKWRSARAAAQSGAAATVARRTILDPFARPR